MKGPHAALLLNNAEWLLPLKLVDFLRDIGKHFSINAMIAKESVRWRLEERGQGISFTEFSYMLLQAYDFYHLYEHQGCSVQAGGKDQWGNITAGIDLIRRMSGGSAHGITFPAADHGIRSQDRKTEGAEGSEMIWLDPEMTSPYRMYQYWINTDDRDVIKFLKLFTFLELPGNRGAGRNPEARSRKAGAPSGPGLRVHQIGPWRKNGPSSPRSLGDSLRERGAGDLQRGLRCLAAEVPSTRFPGSV